MQRILSANVLFSFQPNVTVCLLHMLFISPVCKPFPSNPISQCSVPRSLQTHASLSSSLSVNQFWLTFWRIFSLLEATVRLFSMSNCYSKSLEGLYYCLMGLCYCSVTATFQNCFLSSLSTVTSKK